MSTRDPAAAYLHAYRRSVASAPQVRDRNLQRVRQRLAAGETIAWQDEPDVAPVASAWTRRVAGVVAVAKPVGLSVALAAASLGVVKVGASASLHHPDPVVSAAPVVSVDAVVSVAPPAAPHPQPVPSAAASQPVSPPELDASAPPVAVPQAIAREQSAVPVARAAPRPATDRLKQEVALLQAAREQLQAAQHEDALASLARHAAQFPEGALQQERRAWQAIALCRLARPEAAAAAVQFLARDGHSPLAAKVKAACAQ